MKLSDRLRKLRPQAGGQSHNEWLRTAEGQAHCKKIESWVARMDARDCELGKGDGDHFRVLLEVRDETGLDIQAIGDMPLTEFDKLAAAILRKRSENEKSDTKNDTPKKADKKNKRRAMNVRAIDCCRLFKADNLQLPMKTIVEDYVIQNGGSSISIMRVLNDNPEQWKDDIKAT